MNKKKVLICIDWYVPGFKAGGPIRSVANIVNAFKKDVEFYVLTSAYDLGETKPYPGVPLNQWHDQGGVFIKYLDKTALNFPTIKGNLVEVAPDVIYLNSLFSKIFTIYPLRYSRKYATNVILAPRGMLGKGALEIKSQKKKAFLSMVKMLGWYKNITWHASTSEEEYEIKSVFGEKANIKIAQNIPISQELELDDILNRKKTGVFKFVFLSRIAKKKNLHLAIEALKEVKSDAPIEFDIYGNIEDKDYYNSFKKSIDSNSADNITINYKGVIIPSKVPEVYADADYMLLPTKHENYGHAIVEAWANGCPVIISKHTPWKNLRSRDLGWDISLDSPDHLVKAIQESVDLDFTSYIQMVRASYHFFERSIMDENIINDNRTLFNL